METKINGIIIEGRVYMIIESEGHDCTECDLGIPPHPKCTAECTAFNSGGILRYSKSLTDKLNKQ